MKICPENCCQIKNDIEFVAPPSERRWVTGVAHWVHSAIDEHNEMIANLMLVLCTSQRIEQALPFGHALGWVGYLDLLQQSPDLCAGQTLRGVGKNTTGSFQVLGTERRNS